MSDSELIYELEADPPAAEKFFAALQHVSQSLLYPMASRQVNDSFAASSAKRLLDPCCA